MHNTYFSSTVVSLGGRGSVSFSSNDCSHFLNESFQRHPLLGSSSSACCCSCCSCYACSTPRVPVNPSYLYGWRQSNLIQWSCSRRLVLGGGRRYYNGLDPGIYDVSCTVKRRSGDGRVGRTRCVALEDESERGGLGDVEAIISLLSEEVDEECFGGRERSRRGSIRRVEMESRGNYGREGYARKKKNIGLSSLESNSKCKIELRDKSNRQREERKSLSIGQSNKGRKKNVGLTALESESKGRFESVNTALGENDFSKDDNRRMRKEGSTSSYYSLSTSSEFESDVEAQAEHGGLQKESSSEFRKDSRTEEGRFSEEVEEMHVDDSVEEASRQKHTAVVSVAEWDWRKNSEKKLAQVSVEEDQYRKESLQMDSRMTRIKESDYGKTSSSREQVKDAEETLTMVGSSKNGTHKQYSQSESRTKYEESGIDKSSRTQNQISGREEKGSAMITAGDHHKIVGTIAQKYNSSSEQLTRMPEQQTVTESASNLRRQSETRMKSWEETTTSVLSSGRKTEEQHHLTGERTTGQGDLRKKINQGFTVMSETRDSNTEKTSILQSGSRVKSKSQNFGVASSSGPGAGRQHSRTDEGVVWRSQSQKGLQDATTSSVHSDDSVTIPSSRSSSEKRVNDQQINLTSTVRRVVETREKHSETDERVMQEESRKWTGKHKVSSFHENDLKEATSSGASLTLVSPFRSQKIDIGEENQRNSPARMIPPSAQLVSRGSFHIEPASAVPSSEQVTPLDIEPYGGAGRGETYGEPSIFVTNEDALGSAYRSQKFSTQYVGDFVEQARHEMSTSEIQKEKKVSETMLVHEDENHGRKALGQYDSGDSQLKEHESKRTSGVSGTKGPSDEMWDVTDPSFREPSNAEDPEVTIPTENASENAIVRKSGRTMWNIIGDIARLRWGSHTESPGSAVRSGSKSSPDESVGTEAWFSGREHEGSSDEKAEKKIIVPQEPTSYEQQLGKSSPSEGEASDTMRSKDKKRDTETYISDPPSRIETGSAAISLTSDGENLGSNEDRRSFPGSPSGSTLVESSLPLSGRDSRRSSSTGEISETSKTDVSRHGSVEKMEQPSNIRQTGILESEGKDGELKRRRLQREKQIMKDTFDDWEEAYKHESEQRKIDEMFMREALLESKKAADAWEVPVGAILVQNGTIIARGYNLVEELRDSTAHAEMICIREASNQLKTWRLADTTLYVTLEPCPMCAGAILQARIDTLVWGAPNKLLGADGSWVRLFPNSESQKDSEDGGKPAGPVHPFHPNMKIRRGVLAGECADVMQQFFQLRRKKKTKNPDLPTSSTSSTLAARRHPSKFISKMQQMFHIMFCL